MIRSARINGLCWLGGLCLLAGCGRQEPLLYPVQGKVYWKDQPATGAMVVFHPLFSLESGNQKPRAYVKEDGHFQLTTNRLYDGAPSGRYAVTVHWRPYEDEDEEPGPNLLPPRYASPRSSGLEVDIQQGANRLPAMRLK